MNYTYNVHMITEGLLEDTKRLGVCIYKIIPSSTPGFIEITLGGPHNSIKKFEKILCQLNLM